jgi:SAM-dependent methyltransferase
MKSPDTDVLTTNYGKAFYNKIRESSLNSARCVVPLVLDLVRPRSIIDLGCGTGTWLSVFADAGVGDIAGVDGPHVDLDQLAIPRSHFTAHDLSKPFMAQRQYDLAVSLEVAEHLPPESAVDFVHSLVRLAPVVLFSAAAPHQAGTHHVNNQWPAYWSRLFGQLGYVGVDQLRFDIWEDTRIEWWYRQNIMFYVCESRLDEWPALKELRRTSRPAPLPLVHPEMFEQLLAWALSREAVPPNTTPDVK